MKKKKKKQTKETKKEKDENLNPVYLGRHG